MLRNAVGLLVMSTQINKGDDKEVFRNWEYKIYLVSLVFHSDNVNE